jgi:hypothetical protein
MRSFSLALAILILASSAWAGNRLLLGAGGGAGGGPPLGPGKLLMVDGVSFVLQVDAASKICLTAGC